MSADADPSTPAQGPRAWRFTAAEAREFCGVLLVLVAAVLALALLVALATEGAWERVALAVGAGVLLAAGRWLARYDPRMAAVKRAQRRERAELAARVAP